MDAVLDLGRVLYEPGAVFERVRERPRFLAPVLVLMGLSLVIGLLALPFIKAAMAAVMAQRAPAGAAVPNPGLIALLQVVGSALVLPLLILIAAGVLWIVVSLFGENANYRQLLSVSAYATILYILQLAAGIAVLTLKGTENLTPADLQPSFGLDLLAPNMTGYFGAVLKGINVFSVWGVVLQGIGITKTHNTSKQTGYAAATVAFLIAVLVFSLFALLQPRTA